MRFSTVGPGHFKSGFEPGTIAGAASSRVESGEGQFAAARGFITSNFTVTDSGLFILQEGSGHEIRRYPKFRGSTNQLRPPDIAPQLGPKNREHRRSGHLT